MENQITSSAAQVIISLIPIVGIGIGGIIIFFAMLWRHHENNLQIKNGTYRKEKFNLKAYSLLIGILFTGIGIILSVFFLILDRFSPSLLGGLIPLTLGICLLVFNKLNRWD